MILTKSLGFKTIVPTTKTSNNSDNDISNIWKNLLISYYSYRILNRLGVCYYTLYIHAITINMDNKIKLALQDLHEAIINKIQEVKFLEKKITSLSIENAKLHDEIDKLNKIIIKHQSEERDLDIKISNKITAKTTDIQFEKEDRLVNDDTTQDIDISINQLKNILNRK